MKKTKTRLLILLTSITIIGLASCASEQKKAYNTADNFLEAYFAGDFSTAKKYATSESGSRIDELAQEWESNVTYEIIGKALIKSDTSAMVNYTTSNTIGERILNLVKDNEGKWKVYLGKYDSVEIQDLLKNRLKYN